MWRGLRMELGVLLLAGAGVCLVAISGQSFWIDECGVAYKAAIPSLPEFWRKISTEGSADLQQPFHHFFAWGWEKAFGIGEFALRSGNLLFLLMGVATAFQALANEGRLRRFYASVILASPFVWYYLNEARPYSVQIGASLVVFSGMYRLRRPSEAGKERAWVAALCFGMGLLACSGMLAMLWLGGYVLAAGFSAPRARLESLLRSHAALWAVTCVWLLGMGLFYVWTVSIGARATAVGGTDTRNLFFIVYELLGFGGLGPGRLEIREGGLGVFARWAPWLGIYGSLLAIVLLAGLRRLAAEFTARERWVWPVAFALVAGFILAVGVAAHFRVLGRHCAPVLPMALFVVATGLLALWDRAGGRVAVVAVLSLNLVSSLMVRFAERHAKDDYRAAAAFGRAALDAGETVWWSADPEGAAIYGLPTGTNIAPAAVYVRNPVEGFEQNAPAPTLVITSKPDVYDAFGALEAYLKANQWMPATNFTAFTLWRREALQDGGPQPAR